MIRLIRIELAKLTTIRLGYILLGTAAGLTVFFSILEASMAGGTGKYSAPPLYTVSGFDRVADGGIWTMLLALVLGATITTGEFRYKTATMTYLAVPSRMRVLAAKVAAGAVAGAVFTLTGFLISFSVAFGFASAHGYGVPTSDLHLARFGAGYLVAGALMSALGVCVGALVKSQLGATVGVLVWSIIVESVVGGLYHPIWRFLPYTASTTVAGIAVGDGAFGPENGGAYGGPLPFLAAVALVAGIAAAIAAVASRTTVRADIT
jgi:ABC-2 type transport system permease protein